MKPQHCDLLNLNIVGIGRVDELLAQGRVEEARDHLISCARAVWTGRWLSLRQFTLRRLGEELEAARFPELAPIIESLRQESPEGARMFLDYLRRRPRPDISRFVIAPAAPEGPANPAGMRPDALWQASVATGQADFQAQLDARIDQYLDPVNVIGWHETSRAWGRLVASAIRHGGIDDATLCKLILFGLDYAEQCNVVTHLSEPTQSCIGGNHLFNHISAWLTFAAMFPEFRRTPALKTAVLARLEDELSKQVTPDGAMIEGAPGYHNCCLYFAGCVLDLCRDMGIELPEAVHEAFKRMLRFALTIMRPDGRGPMLGDSQDDQTAGYTQCLRPFYDMQELDWVATEGRQGRPPTAGSAALDCIGYYVLRTGWERQALYLCFDGGRFGQAHHHEDKLHFELYALGRMFLIDPGVHSYSDHWFRQWTVLSAAHNTILVDGVGQCRWRQDRHLWYSHVPLNGRFETQREWDLVEADFDGPYERDIGRVRLRRRVALHQGDVPFWWVTDRVEGEGQHEVTEVFHFAHDIERVEPIPGGVRTDLPGAANLALVQVDGSGVDGGGQRAEVRRYRGQENPPRGWVSPKLNEVAPAWEVHLVGSGKLPIRRDFVLLPCPGAAPARLQARAVAQGAGKALELVVGERTLNVPLPEW